MTTHISFLQTKSSVFMLIHNKAYTSQKICISVIECTIHLYYMMIENEITIAQKAKKILFAQYINIGGKQPGSR